MWSRSSVQWGGLVGGPLMALGLYWILPAQYRDATGGLLEFSPAGRFSAVVGAWMAVWWLAEAAPIAATALLPLALLPLWGATTMKAAAAPYGHYLIFLFMGGFILSLAMQRWGLHKRIALLTLKWVGTKPRNMVGGFMLCSAFMSMWVSNTATAVMMLPIALSVIQLLKLDAGGDARGANFSICVLLGIAYACSIGGLGTIIGTPPNLFLVSYAREHLDVEISFARWLGIGIPLVVVFLPITWLLLTRWIFPVSHQPVPGAEQLAREAYRDLGPLSRGERLVLVVFLTTAAAWIFRPLLTPLELGGWQPLAGLTDAGIAMIAAITLFVLPVDPRKRIFVMDWESTRELPWGILILFGGGLSLAAALDQNGVGQFLAGSLTGLKGVPEVLLVLAVVGLIIFLTELTSNTATTAALVPLLAGIAPALGVNPFLLIVPATIAASCAFMMPVATPPNAIVFSAGYVSIPQMSKAGLWLNLIAIGLITFLAYAVFIPALGISHTRIASP